MQVYTALFCYFSREEHMEMCKDILERVRIPMENALAKSGMKPLPLSLCPYLEHVMRVPARWCHIFLLNNPLCRFISCWYLRCGANWRGNSHPCHQGDYYGCLQERAEYHTEFGWSCLEGVCPSVRHALSHVQGPWLQCERHPALPHPAEVADGHGGGSWVRCQLINRCSVSTLYSWCVLASIHHALVHIWNFCSRGEWSRSKKQCSYASSKPCMPITALVHC